MNVVQEDGEGVLRIRDTGVGISPEMLPRIFDLFTQGDQSLAHTSGGLGVGLTLVHRLIELHGGRVSVHSDGAGRGSEFTIRLPLSGRRRLGSPRDRRGAGSLPGVYGARHRGQCGRPGVAPLLPGARGPSR